MFIGLCGAICAGKHSVAKFLVKEYGFKVLRLAVPASTPLPQDENVETTVVIPRFPECDVFTFPSVDALVDYVTPRWQERFVTTEVWTEDILEALLRRPFFILVSVDAPIVVRWKRYLEK
ncbi:hypothetical protein ABW19_dt0201123 [Dactylella cylindrospora]|nr:hypothetical protein ABW19_dt0201123 [Dactylella cylindrospora]